MDIGNLLHTLINTPGIGGVIVTIVFTFALTLYIVLTRWILKGEEEEDNHHA